MRFLLVVLLIAAFFAPISYSVIADDDISPTYAKQQILEDLSVGKWTIQGSTDGQEMEGQLEGKWAPGKYCVVFSGYVQAKGGDDKEHLTGILGWDKATGKIKEQIFSSGGGAATALFEVRDRVLVGTRKGVMKDGAKYKQDLRFVIGENGWVGEPTSNIGGDGKVLAKQGKWVFSRIESK